MQRILLLLGAAGAALGLAAVAPAHFDHPVPAFEAPTNAPASSELNAGGTNASWDLLATVATGNPHSDLDFFTSKGDMYASVGTLGVGPNAGGQTIVRLTDKGKIAPTYVASHPSAACASVVSGATALQHDVEATPKGQVIFNAPNPYAVTRDAQLLLDATDGTGRCHDNGTFGQGAPNGGIEIIDITDPAAPKEIGLVSHIGNAHTINVDPKRPHIAFDVTQDGVLIGPDGRRANETSGNALDGFEVLDLKSCMDFPAGTTIEEKRLRCRPQVYRFRYPDGKWATSHTYPNNLQSCHEVEIYPDDVLACASITATLLLDVSQAFDDGGTPTDFSDDRPRGKPLPCAVRDSSSVGIFGTGAKVTDCVTGTMGGQPQPLTVAAWLSIGAPALTGVKRIGTVHHMGFGATQDLVTAPFDATQDVIAAHESELSGSGKFVFTSDERGGGVVPGGASCSPGVDNVRGNGGLHAFPVASFRQTVPKDSAEAQQAYAKTSSGGRAIYRAAIRTQPQASVCTAHVFQQIPGQNRIFMAWYSQGTQVVDFTENADGTIDFKEAGYFVPEGANTWTSAIFKVETNADGSFSYYGATGDGILPGTGRGAVDVYKVTLPKPPLPAGERKLGTPVFPKAPGDDRPCARAAAFTNVRATPRGRGVRFSFTRTGNDAVRVDLLRVTAGKRVVRGARGVDFGVRARAFTFSGKARGLRDGYYVARFRTRAADGSTDVRRAGLRRVRGRFRATTPLERRKACDLLDLVRLERPVVGGSTKLAAGLLFRLDQPARVRVEIRRGRRVVRRLGGSAFVAGRTHRLAISPRGLRRGPHTIVIRATNTAGAASATLGFTVL